MSGGQINLQDEIVTAFQAEHPSYSTEAVHAAVRRFLAMDIGHTPDMGDLSPTVKLIRETPEYWGMMR